MTDLRQLRHFVAVAEHGHFARAADAINLSQPALSRSIQALEANLGCSLFDRGPRQATLTAHGHLVLEHARRLLAGSRALHNAVGQLGNLESGELRLGAGPFPAARLIPQALGRLAHAHPKVRIQLAIGDWASLRQRLLGESIELFVADCRELMGDPQLCVEPLPPYEGVYFCRPGHPLLERQCVGLEDIGRYPLASPQLPAEVVSFLQERLGRDSLPDVQCDNFTVLRQIVRQSDILSLAPLDVVASDIEAGLLAVLPLEEDMDQRTSAYGLISRAGHSLSPAAQALRALVLDESGMTAQ